MKKLRRCAICKEYTLDASHCGKMTEYGHPPPFNMKDRWAKYRRQVSGVGAKNV